MGSSAGKMSGVGSVGTCEGAATTAHRRGRPAEWASSAPAIAGSGASCESAAAVATKNLCGGGCCDL